MSFEYESHAPVKMYRAIPWLVCKHCGLLYLRNDFTKWCIDKGCNNADHPNYKQAMREYSSTRK